MTDETQIRVEVFQPRDNPVKRTPAETLEEMDFAEFGEEFHLVGTDTIPADTEDPKGRVFERWNNAPQTERSEAFRKANDAERAVSLSVGHIVRIEGTAYLVESIGWSELENLSY